MSKSFRMMKPGKYSVFLRRRRKKMHGSMYHTWWQYLFIIIGPTGGGAFFVTHHLSPQCVKRNRFKPLRPGHASNIEHEVVDCLRELTGSNRGLLLHGITDRKGVFKKIHGELADRGLMSPKMDKSARP